MIFYQNFMEEAPDIDLTWTEIADVAVEEKVSLMLASNDLPDAFMDTLTENQVMNNTQQLLPIEDYINPDVMPYFSEVLEKRPEYLGQITAPDGHIYSLPYIEEMYGLITSQGVLRIYQPWLDELGLPMPTTIDEYRDTLKQFVENDMNGNGEADEIGLAMANQEQDSGIGSWRNNTDFGKFFGLWGQADRGDSMAPDENGNIISTATTEAYKTGIQYLHEMYQEGLIDPNFMTTEHTGLQSKLRSDDVIVGSVLSWGHPVDLAGEERGSGYVPVPNLQGPGGEFGTRENLSELHNPAAFAMSREVENPEKLLEWVDLMYKPEWSVQANWGPLSYYYEENEDGVMVQGEVQDGLDNHGEMRHVHTIADNNPLAVLDEYWDEVVMYEPGAQRILDDMYASGYFDGQHEQPYIPNTLLYEPEVAERMAIISPIVYGLIDTKRREWIVEGGVEEEWDDYLAELERSGWDEFIGYVQDAYDDYLENQ
nr:extracellular solute-binding protein [Gracilibacillus alcaliphilus]